MIAPFVWAKGKIVAAPITPIGLRGQYGRDRKQGCGGKAASAYLKQPFDGGRNDHFRRPRTFLQTKFALDAELRFKAEARRNRLLGEWAAGLLGKTGDEARTYALTVVTSDFEEPGEDDVFRKLSEDLADRADEATIRTKMAELREEARRQIASEA